MKEIKEWQRIITEWAISNGYDWETSEVDTMLLRIHSEVTEAGEALRDGNLENFKRECADIFIRLVNLCEVFGFDLEEYVEKVHERNKNRPYLHGRARK